MATDPSTVAVAQAAQQIALQAVMAPATGKGDGLFPLRPKSDRLSRA
jgi:hypothetical protein